MIARTVRPSRWYYGLAILVFVAGLFLFVLFLIGGLGQLSNRLVQVVVPGEYDMTFSDVGKYTVFYEYQSVVRNKVYSTSQNISGLRCRLVSKEPGVPVILSRPLAKTTYSLGGRAGVSVLSFTINKPGQYEFSASYPEGKEGPEVVLAIGSGFAKKLLKTVFGALAIIFGTAGLAAVTAIVTFLRRRKAIERLEGQYPDQAPIEPS